MEMQWMTVVVPPFERRDRMIAAQSREIYVPKQPMIPVPPPPPKKETAH
jgi:hypothetical protein